MLLHQSKMDSRLRENDGQESWGFVKTQVSRRKTMEPKHLQHFPRINKIFPGQQWAKAGSTDSGALNVKEFQRHGGIELHGFSVARISPGNSG